MRAGLRSQAFFKTDDRLKSAIRINNNFNTFHATMCTQCGECINMCTAHAIYRDKNGVVRIDKKKVRWLPGLRRLLLGTLHVLQRRPVGPFRASPAASAKACPENALEILVSKA